MTTRSFCISAAVLLLAMTLTWPTFPGQGNTNHIGSQSSGAGAGKVTFNLFSVTKKTDKSSPALMRKGGDEKLQGADVKGYSTDNRP
jgi:type VI protein secretion system component Hcp